MSRYHPSCRPPCHAPCHARRVFSVASFLVLLVTSTSVPAEDTIVPPAGGQDSLSFSEADDVRLLVENVEATASWAAMDDMPFSTLYRIDSDTRFSDPKNTQVIVPLTKGLNRGDVVMLSFWMRRPNAGGQPNHATFTIRTNARAVADDNQDAEADATTKADATTEAAKPVAYEYKLSAYREWKQHVRSFVTPANYDPSQTDMVVELGEAGPVAEIADLRLLNYGADYDITTLPRSTVNYRGREPDAQWRKDAQARIEQIRKGDLTIEVVDQTGRPVSGVDVKVEMRQHAFGFGNTVNSRILGGEESDFPFQRRGVEITWDEAQSYREIIQKYFDRVTFESELRPHIWQLQMGEDAKWKREHVILMEHTVPWLQANNKGVRGHYIAWAPMDFNAVEKEFVGDPDAHHQWLWDHMSDVLPKTAGFVTEWDTINHIIGWGKHTYEMEYGGPQIYADIMKEARRLAPNATHAINEGKVLPDGYKREPYKKIIRFLNEQGQAPDIVGFMAHFGLTSLTPPEELLQVYDEFGEIAPKLQLSEFDVEAGDDEELQADYYRDVMIASFSHPNMEAIVQWGFWEKAHWKPQAALWRTDFTLKPSGEVFVDLVANQWWTDESVQTDDRGLASVRGFLGDYQLFVEHGGDLVTQMTQITREGNRVRLVLPTR